MARGDGNSAQTSDAGYYIMEGAEYDTAPPVVAGTFNGKVTEKMKERIQ